MLELGRRPLARQRGREPRRAPVIARELTSALELLSGQEISWQLGSRAKARDAFRFVAPVWNNPSPSIAAAEESGHACCPTHTQ